jgi:hypothetical protein
MQPSKDYRIFQPPSDDPFKQRDSEREKVTARTVSKAVLCEVDATDSASQLQQRNADHRDMWRMYGLERVRSQFCGHIIVP